MTSGAGRLVAARDAAPSGKAKGRRRSRKETEQELKQAMLRVEEKGSITAVALEAGVTPGLIHNTYPDIAEKIRAEGGRSTRQQRDQKIAELAQATEQLRELRGELDAARGDLRNMASINETLRAELATLRLVASGKVAVLPQRPEG